MLRLLKKGAPRALAVLADRAYGKVKEQVELDVSQTVVENALSRVANAPLNVQAKATFANVSASWSETSVGHCSTDSDFLPDLLRIFSLCMGFIACLTASPSPL